MPCGLPRRELHPRYGTPFMNDGKVLLAFGQVSGRGRLFDYMWVLMEVSRGGRSGKGATLLQKGEEWMGQGRIHDVFAREQLGIDQVVEQVCSQVVEMASCKVEIGCRLGFPI